ncbi:MAG: alpha/beta hydrolase [Alphaproteobacteria bacterium]|jgi:acetyl esterase/lipase|nr:alpha/beta hydrolase [Alphaproteobacteria bacterium]
MQPLTRLSEEALTVIEKGITPRDRSAQNLPAIRAKSKAVAKAEAPRLCRTHGVMIVETVIGGVPCLEVSPPDRRVDWPVLYGFGGGMVEGSPIEDLPIIAPLSALSGARFIAPDYSLAPEHPWPAGLDDCFVVYRELAENHFAIVGESAGANLTLALMLKAKAEGLRLPGAAALLSPWCDLSNAGDSLIFNEGRDPTLAKKNSYLAASYYAGVNRIDQPLISPIHGAFDPGFPPFLITTGTRDLLLSQSVRLSQRLRDSGAQVDLHVWEGLWHVFEWYEALPEARQSIARIADHLIRGMAVD